MPRRFHWITFDVGGCLPPGWKEAYRAWAEAGWNAVSAPPQWGGQDLPRAVNAACTEMWNAAAMAFGVGPLLTTSAVDALLAASRPANGITHLGPFSRERSMIGPYQHCPLASK